jgi:disulfide bond formation protein DsbB
MAVATLARPSAGIAAPSPRLRLARALALLLPAALLGGAWIGQLGFGLVPCEMCHWQRWPHYAALVIALAAFGPRYTRPLVALAAVAIATSGAIGVYHAGVEWHWWAGATACTSTFGGHGLSNTALLNAVLNAPIVRCDEAQWRLLGISLAGWNALFSLGGAGVIAGLLGRGR